MQNRLKRTFVFCLLLFALSARSAFAERDIYVIHFVLDGLRYDVLHKQIGKNTIPTLEKYFVENGAVFDKALAVFPTVSSPGYIGFTTGLGAGNSGVFFLEWFDRIKKKPVGYLTPSGYFRINNDMLNQRALGNPELPKLYNPTTIFEKLSPISTASLYTPFRRGVTIAIPKKIPVKGLWSSLITKDGLALNQMAMQELQKLFSQSGEKIPRYTLVALYGPDFYGHKTGPHSEEVEWDLRQFDAYFKQFMALLEKQGLKDKTYLVLSSDHGMHPTGKLLELRKILAKKGVQEGKKIHVTNRGVSSTFLYAAGEKGWEDLPSLYDLQNFPTKKSGPIDLIQTLVAEESIGWLAARDDLDRVKVFDRKGEGLITQVTVGEETFYSYQYRGGDPLGYSENPDLAALVDGKPHTALEWFQATVDEKRPNAVVELSNLFKNPRAGDLLVMANEPWSFRTAKAGTHGSLERGDMHIPLWLWGPDVPKGRFDAARSVDVYPTVLKWFGMEEEVADQEGLFLFEAKKGEEKEKSIPYLVEMEKELVKRPNFHKSIDKQIVTQELNRVYPTALRQELLNKCEAELQRRHQQWKKLYELEQMAGQKENPLNIDKKNLPNMKWLLTNELNMEWIRLRRMENIKSILENP